MSNNQSKQIETYQDLCKMTLVISLVMVTLHLMGAIVLDYVWGGGAVGKAVAVLILVHLSYLRWFPMYVSNYKYLVRKRELARSKKTFWYGLLPLIASEVVNMIVLIFLLCK